MEQTLEQKKRAILNAVELGLISGSKLEPSRKGSTVSALKKGKAVSPAAIERLYAVLAKIRPDLCDIEQILEQTPEQMLEQNLEQIPAQNSGRVSAQKIEQTPEQMLEQIPAQKTGRTGQENERSILRVAIDALNIRMDALESRLRDVESKLERGETRETGKARNAKRSVMGFRLVLKKTRTGGKTYLKWYAVKGSKVVYVGSDPEKARAKIESYMERRK